MKRLSKKYLLISTFCSTVIILFSILFIKQNTSKEIIFPYADRIQRTLSIHIKLPDPKIYQGTRPAILMFHGGGWKNGGPAELEFYAEYFKNKGYITGLAEYRLMNKDGTTPFDAIDDATLALKQFSTNISTQLPIDTKRITVMGGSAGGHLAFWATNNNQEYASKLILLSAPLDVSGEGFGQDRFGSRWKEGSPLENMTKNLPPTLLFHSLQDLVVPVHGIEKFVHKAKNLGVIIKPVWLKDATHGFYILPTNFKFSALILDEIELFLSEHMH